RVQATHISDTIRIILDEESEDPSTEDRETGDRETGDSRKRWPNPNSVGIILSRLRLKKDKAKTASRDRSRLVSKLEIIQHAIAHHLVVFPNMSKTSEHVHLSNATPPPQSLFSDVDTPQPNEVNGGNGVNGGNDSLDAQGCAQRYLVALT